MFARAPGLPSCIREIFNGGPSSKLKRRAKTRLSVELLENRTAPAVFQVTVLTDAIPAAGQQAAAGSLRRAVDDLIAPGNNDATNQIMFANNLNGTINLVDALPRITKNVQIIGKLGGGLSRVTIARPANAQNDYRILDFGACNTALVSGLTILRGQAGQNADGGGIRAVGLDELTITNCVFTENTARNGAGLQASLVNNVSIIGCHFNNNIARTDGGAIEMQGRVLTISNNSLFNGNGAGSNGGAIFAVVRDLTITGGRFAQNVATNFDGGAICLNPVAVQNATLNITRTAFILNRAMQGDGGGQLQIHLEPRARFENARTRTIAQVRAADSSMIPEMLSTRSAPPCP